MRLVYEDTHQPVVIGDVVTISNGARVRVDSIEKPRHGGSTGRVYVQQVNEQGLPSGYSHGFFPAVIGAEWIERDDQ
jgi:hypothetical protein